MRRRRNALSIVLALALAVGVAVVTSCTAFSDASDTVEGVDGAASESDANVVPSSDGGSATDGSASDGPSTRKDAGADGGASVCGSGCATGSTCKSQGCEIDGEPACGAGAIIEVPEGGGRFFGKVCATTTPSNLICSSANPGVHGHVFHLAGLGSFSISFKAVSTTLRANVIDSSCAAPTNRGCAVVGAGGTGGLIVQGGGYFGVGFDETSGCADYSVVVTTK